MTHCPNCKRKTKFNVQRVGGRSRELLSGEQRFQTVWFLVCERCHQPFEDSYPPEDQLVPLKIYELEETP